MYQDIAIEVLRHRDSDRVRSLCNFLAALPDPQHRRGILLGAILYYVESPEDKAVLDWVVQNQAIFRPDLDLVDWARRQIFQENMSEASCAAVSTYPWSTQMELAQSLFRQMS